MTPLPSYDAVAVGQQCLQQMDALRHELEVATDAVARNSLYDFEQSLWQQEMLSQGLRRSLSLLRSLAVDATLVARVRSASGLLQQTSRTYQKLIAESGRSAAVLHDLCNLYQHAPATAAVSVRQQALSCEA